MMRTRDVVVNPLQGLLHIQDAEVLRLLAILQLGRVRGGKDALAGVEVDVDDTVASKVRALYLRVAA